MRKWLLSLLVAASLAVPRSGSSSRAERGDSSLTMLLPCGDAPTGWVTSEDPQVVRGEDLYLLIDGGAEIFLEYGFKRALIQSYGDGKGRSINLEIYEMTDHGAAYGIYTYRTGEGGTRVPIGDDGRFEDYYLNLWKGNFLVTVIGFDTDEETIDGITALAEAVAARIEEGGERPHLAGILPEDGLKPNGIEYMRGILALRNSYEFDRDNIFGLSEGVMGRYEGHTVFLFFYGDEAECRKRFRGGVDRLKTSPRFHDPTPHGEGYAVRDGRGGHLRLEPYRNFIVIVIGETEDTGDPMARQKAAIDHAAIPR